MKRNATICLVFFIVFTFLGGTALAAPEYTGNIKDSVTAILIDADTGEELYSQNKDETIEPASTTKIMTCILAIENSNMDDEVVISQKAASSTLGSVLGIRTNEKFKMIDLLTGMMLKSGNDAAIAVAEHISGSITDFAALMNEKAQSIGMTSTNFVNPNGLHNDNHNSTASDMAKLARYAMQNQTFRDIVRKDTYDMPKTNKQNARTIENTNELLSNSSDYYYSNATGVKTGSTTNAGGCLVSSATKDGMNLICLIYNDQTTKRTDRWKYSKDLFEWGFENFKNVDLTSLMKSDEPITAQIQDYDADDTKDGLLEFEQPEMGTIAATLPNDVAQALLGGTDTIEAKTSFDKELVAPIAKGDIIGTVTYSIKSTGEQVYSYNLIASRDIKKEDSTGKTPVATLPPTPSATVEKTENNTLFIIILIVIAGGLIAFLVVRMIMASKRRHFKKRRRPHYSYRK